MYISRTYFFRTLAFNYVQNCMKILQGSGRAPEIEELAGLRHFCRAPDAGASPEQGSSRAPAGLRMQEPCFDPCCGAGLRQGSRAPAGLRNFTAAR